MQGVPCSSADAAHCICCSDMSQSWMNACLHGTDSGCEPSAQPALPHHTLYAAVSVTKVHMLHEDGMPDASHFSSVHCSFSCCAASSSDLILLFASSNTFCVYTVSDLSQAL